MHTPQQDILNDIFVRTQRRRALLPLWIKIFIWIFFVVAATAPVALLVGALGGTFKLGMFGLETDDPFSVVGFMIITIFLFKGIVSYALWNEKSIGVKLAIIDATATILVCVFTMIYSSESLVSFRLELIPLILYLRKMLKIRKEWEAEYVLAEQPAIA